MYQFSSFFVGWAPASRRWSLLEWNRDNASCILCKIFPLKTQPWPRYRKSLNIQKHSNISGSVASAQRPIICLCISWCSWPVHCLSFDTPPLEWWWLTFGWRIENQKPSSSAPIILVAHLRSWSKNILCQWRRGSGVRKQAGSDIAQSCQNGLSTPFNWYFFLLGLLCKCFNVISVDARRDFLNVGQCCRTMVSLMSECITWTFCVRPELNERSCHLHKRWERLRVSQQCRTWVG